MSPKAEPQAHILESYANASHLNWGVVLAEAIDNSLDAEATHVAINIERNRYLLIADNGRGCSDPVAMVTLGTKFAHKRQDLGRY